MTTQTVHQGRPVEILLVEDNPGDVDLTRQGLKDGKILNNLHVVGNGDDAMAFLRREGDFTDTVRPDLAGKRRIVRDEEDQPLLVAILAEPVGFFPPLWPAEMAMYHPPSRRQVEGRDLAGRQTVRIGQHKRWRKAVFARGHCRTGRAAQSCTRPFRGFRFRGRLAHGA